MKYGLRYCFLYRAKMRGHFLYEVIIEEKGYDGEAEVLKPCGNVLTIRQGAQDDSPFVPIKGSEATIEILCTNDMRYLSLFTVDPRRFRVSVYEYRPDTAGKEVPILIWRGFLDANSYSEKFARTPYKVTLKATDGLAALGNYSFCNDKSEKLKGLKSVRELLDMCLAQLGLELPVSEWIGIKHSPGNTDTLRSIYYDCSDIYSDNPEATWGDVLKLCLPYGAQIFQASGTIHIRRTASLIYGLRPETFSGSHTLQGISRTPLMTLWQNGCDISSEAELKVLPPLNRIGIKGSGEKKILAEVFDVYNPQNWFCYDTDKVCSFDDCVQLKLVASSSLRRIELAKKVHQSKKTTITIKFDVSNLLTDGCPLSFGVFIADERTKNYPNDGQKISVWDREGRQWVDMTWRDMFDSKYKKYMVDRTIGASELENPNIKHRVDKTRFTSESFDFTIDSIPYDGYLSIRFLSLTYMRYIQISNIEITTSGEVENAFETERNVIINRDNLEKLSVDTFTHDGGYIPNINLYLNNVIRTVTGYPSAYLISQYGGSENFGLIETDARALRGNIAYSITGEFRSSSPVDINTLLVDHKYTQRVYYINYFERIFTRGLYKAQLYQLMDINTHPIWTGTFKSIIDRNEYDINGLYAVDGTIFFSEKSHLWRLDANGIPQKILTTQTNLYVYQGSRCVIAAMNGTNPSITAYDSSGIQTAKIENPAESLSVLPSDVLTRDATTGIWYSGHYEKGILTVTIFRDNGCIVDAQTFESEEVQKILFAPNVVIIVTDKDSYIHNFTIHADGELSEVHDRDRVCWISAISNAGVIFDSMTGTCFGSRILKGQSVTSYITIPRSNITALGDRFAAAYEGGDTVYIYDYYNGIMSEIPTPKGRSISQIVIIGSMLYALADNEIMQYFILDDTVLGEGNQYTYILEPIIETATIGAAGGSVEIAARLNVIDENGTLVSSETIKPVITGWAEGFKIVGNTVTAENRATTAGPERELALSLSHPFVRNGIKQTITAQATIHQEANQIERMTVALPQTVSGDLPIPAAGGTVRMAFPLLGVFTSGSTGQLNQYPDAITGSPLATWLRVKAVSLDSKGVGLEMSASDLGTTECPKKTTTINMRLTKQDQFGNQYTIDYAVEVAQAANRLKGYGLPMLVPETIIAGDVPASGGSAGELRFTGAQSEEYSSGDSLPVTFTEATSGLVISYGPRITGNGLGTTAKARTKLGDQRFTVQLRDKTSIEYSVPVYQQANSLDGLSYLSSSLESGTSPIPAAGGSALFSSKLRATYTSEASAEVYPESIAIDRRDDMPAGYTVSSSAVSGKGIGLKCTAPDLGTEVTASRSYTFDATYRYGGRSVSQKGLTLQQSANRIASHTNDGWTVPMIVPAAGGSVSGQLLVTFTYTSKASEQIRITEYASLPVSDGVLTWSTRGGAVVLSAPSRAVTMVNEYKVNKEIGYRYKDTELTATSIYKQQANYITALQPRISAFGYRPISAATTSASSYGTITTTLVFTSGETYNATTPFSNAAGTLTAERRFTLSDIKNGFTAVNVATGVLTATARGTTIGAARTSSPVNLIAKFTFVHSETFVAGGTVSGSASASATCTQQANLVTAIAADSSFSYSAIGAGTTSARPTTLGSGLLTFASGATMKVSNTTQAPAGTDLGVSSEYKLLEVKNGFTAVNAATGVLTATARGTTLGAARTSGLVSRLLTWPLRHDTALFPEESQNLIAGSRSGKGWTTHDRYSDGVFERDNASTSEKYIFAPAVALISGQTYTLSFEYRTTSNVSGVDAYVYRTSGVVVQLEKKLLPVAEWTHVTATFRAGVSDPCVVRFDNNGTTDGATSTIFIRNAQLERGSQASPYLPSPLDVVFSTGKPATAQCTQAANRIERYGTPTLVPSTIEVGDVPASGGITGPIRFSGAQSEEYSSGDSLPATFNQDTAGVTVSISIATPITGSNLGTTLKPRTLLGTIRFQVAAHDQTSAEYSAPVYQQANELASIEYVAGGILSGAHPRQYPAAGGTTELYFQIRAIYTSGANRNVVPTGATPQPGARWIAAQRFEHLTYGDCVRLVVAANTSGTTRTGTVAVSLSYNEGGGTVSTTTNITVSQLAN